MVSQDYLVVWGVYKFSPLLLWSMSRHVPAVLIMSNFTVYLRSRICRLRFFDWCEHSCEIGGADTVDESETSRLISVLAKCVTPHCCLIVVWECCEHKTKKVKANNVYLNQCTFKISSNFKVPRFNQPILLSFCLSPIPLPPPYCSLSALFLNFFPHSPLHLPSPFSYSCPSTHSRIKKWSSLLRQACRITFSLFFFLSLGPFISPSLLSSLLPLFFISLPPLTFLGAPPSSSLF